MKNSQSDKNSSLYKMKSNEIIGSEGGKKNNQIDSYSDKSALIVSPSCYDFTLMLGNAATLRDNMN